MAIIDAKPSQAIIDGFKGTLDFYQYMGLWVCRSWPRSPGRVRSPSVMAQWSTFAYASQEWVNLSDEVRRAYEKLATNSGLSGRDMQVRAYLSGLYRYPTP